MFLRDVFSTWRVGSRRSRRNFFLNQQKSGRAFFSASPTTLCVSLDVGKKCRRQNRDPGPVSWVPFTVSDTPLARRRPFDPLARAEWFFGTPSANHVRPSFPLEGARRIVLAEIYDAREREGRGVGDDSNDPKERVGAAVADERANVTRGVVVVRPAVKRSRLQKRNTSSAVCYLRRDAGLLTASANKTEAEMDWRFDIAVFSF